MTVEATEANKAAAMARKAAKSDKIDLDLKASLAQAMSHPGGFDGYMKEVFVAWFLWLLTSGIGHQVSTHDTFDASSSGHGVAASPNDVKKGVCVVCVCEQGEGCAAIMEHNMDSMMADCSRVLGGHDMS